MNLALRLTILFIGLIFYGAVFRFLYTRSIEERNGLIWIVATFVLGILMIFPDSLDWVAGLLGIDYPPALVFMVGLLFVLLLLLYQSIQISILKKHVKEISQSTALHYHTQNKPLTPKTDIYMPSSRGDHDDVNQ